MEQDPDGTPSDRPGSLIGAVDNVLMRMVDAAFTFPAILFALLLAVLTVPASVLILDWIFAVDFTVTPSASAVTNNYKISALFTTDIRDDEKTDGKLGSGRLFAAATTTHPA